jgi:hypothetical protein
MTFCTSIHQYVSIIASISSNRRCTWKCQCNRPPSCVLTAAEIFLLHSQKGSTRSLGSSSDGKLESWRRADPQFSPPFLILLYSSSLLLINEYAYTPLTSRTAEQSP